MRALAIYVAMQKDIATSGLSAFMKRTVQSRAEFLVPIVKGGFAETAQRVVSNGLQVFGGTGSTEDAGIAQLYRDVRITTIYGESTAIQANDLVNLKTARDDGKVAFSLIDDILAVSRQLQAAPAPVTRELSDVLTPNCRVARGVVCWILQLTGKIQGGLLPWWCRISNYGRSCVAVGCTPSEYWGPTTLICPRASFSVFHPLRSSFASMS